MCGIPHITGWNLYTLYRLGTFNFDHNRFNALTAFTAFDYIRLNHIGFDHEYLLGSYHEEYPEEYLLDNA